MIFHAHAPFWQLWLFPGLWLVELVSIESVVFARSPSNEFFRLFEWGQVFDFPQKKIIEKFWNNLTPSDLYPFSFATQMYPKVSHRQMDCLHLYIQVHSCQSQSILVVFVLFPPENCFRFLVTGILRFSVRLFKLSNFLRLISTHMQTVKSQRPVNYRERSLL